VEQNKKASIKNADRTTEEQTQLRTHTGPKNRILNTQKREKREKKKKKKKKKEMEAKVRRKVPLNRGKERRHEGRQIGIGMGGGIAQSKHPSKKSDKQIKPDTCER